MSDSVLASEATQPVEIIRVLKKSVACDGGGGPLGHPRVWLHLGEAEQIACTYCSRFYVMEGSAADHALDAQSASAEAEENRSV